MFLLDEDMKDLEKAVFIYDVAKNITEFCRFNGYNIRGVKQALEDLDFNCYNLTENDKHCENFFDFDFSLICMTYYEENGLDEQVQIYIKNDSEDFTIQEAKDLLKRWKETSEEDND